MAEVQDIPEINQLISDIKNGKLTNSHNKAVQAQVILKLIISEGKWKTAQELMEVLRMQMKKIEESLPCEVVSVNIIRHFLKIIREEYEASSKRRGEDQSLHQLVTANPDDILDYSENLLNLRNGLLEQLTEYQVELESSTENIINQAPEHIHTNEIILTFGKSHTVEQFLKSAAKKRTFQVIVVESSQVYDGHLMAANLSKSNIQTTLIPDAGVFAMMSRVNKVIIGTHSILASGGLRALSGVHTVALAAKHYSVPVVVVAHIYKLTPFHVGYNEQAAFNLLASPANVLPYSTDPCFNNVKVFNPVFDFVSPELVTLFISHQGANAPSYVYRMLSELYHPEDHEV